MNTSLVIALVAVLVAITFFVLYFKSKLTASGQSEAIIESARKTSAKLIAEARAETKAMVAEARKDVDDRRQELKKIENKIEQNRQRDDQTRQEFNDISKRLDSRQKSLDKKVEDIDQKNDRLRQKEEDIQEVKKMVRELHQKQVEKLEKIGKLTQVEAAEKLAKIVEKRTSQDMAALISKQKRQAKGDAEQQAATILIGAMERISADVTAERTTSSIKISNDKIKGRVIGKEGRNILALQQALGVDILTDDTPNAILVSTFDPVRRHVAVRALETLIKDGRIHPGRIEAVVAKTQRDIQKQIIATAEDAARQAGVIGIPPEIMQLLGELKFRTSYGQNVLQHSIEMAHIAGVLAAQIGADVRICKYAALVHDLGKALTHRMEGKHHHLSGEMLRKYGVSEEIAHAAEAHHDDIEATTLEAMVVRVVDAASASRPGVRNINSEDFIKRQKDVENIATSFRGVTKAYSIDAGREIRVFVKPKQIDDLQSYTLARDIATKIEAMVRYPGTIKVVVIREHRAIEYAK